MTTKTASRLATLSFPLLHWTSNCLWKMSCIFLPIPLSGLSTLPSKLQWLSKMAKLSTAHNHDNTGEKKSEWGLFIPCISFIRGSLIFEGHWFTQWGPVNLAIYWFWEPVKRFWECLSLLFFSYFFFFFLNHHGSCLNSKTFFFLLTTMAAIYTLMLRLNQSWSKFQGLIPHFFSASSVQLHSPRRQSWRQSAKALHS